jgi:DNA adenine methylase
MTENNNDKETYYKIRDEMEINFRLENAKRFYYLRKTRFGGMLKYNKNGDFNVGYGYRKNCNFSDLKNEKYVDLLQNSTVLNTGFEYIFENYNDEKNFMFLDPPYHNCKITNYGYCEFGKEEHKKMAEYFKATNIRCLMVIGKDDFIENLYDGYIISQYYKRYDLNSINKKKVEEAIHLIIKNY